jgi:hypothetical protein
MSVYNELPGRRSYWYSGIDMRNGMVYITQLGGIGSFRL